MLALGLSDIVFAVIGIYLFVNALVLVMTDRTVTRTFGSWDLFEEFKSRFRGFTYDPLSSPTCLAFTYNYLSDVPHRVEIRGTYKRRPTDVLPDDRLGRAMERVSRATGWRPILTSVFLLGDEQLQDAPAVDERPLETIKHLRSVHREWHTEETIPLIHPTIEPNIGLDRATREHASAVIDFKEFVFVRVTYRHGIHLNKDTLLFTLNKLLGYFYTRSSSFPA